MTIIQEILFDYEDPLVKKKTLDKFEGLSQVKWVCTLNLFRVFRHCSKNVIPKR